MSNNMSTVAPVSSPSYMHVSYMWDDAKAASLGNDQVALLVYRSNLLGADLRLTNYGGGNTSCKTTAVDPLSGRDAEVMWVKGSGGDLGTMKRSGLSALFLDRLKDLQHVYRGIEHEDEMVDMYNYCLFDLKSRAPSIDTALHALLPFRHIDHLHPDAAIAIAAARDGKKITEELFEGKIGWIEWQRPGFDLGVKMKRYVQEHPGIEGIMLGSHGLFTWGDTAKESYVNTLNVIEKCAQYLQDHVGKKRPVFGGEKLKSLPRETRLQKAAVYAPLLRGLCSSHTKMIGHFTDDEKVLEFVNSADLQRLAAMGTSCPDHFLRTKIAPLVLDLDPYEEIDASNDVKEKLQQQFVQYRQMYEAYYNECRHEDSPAIRDPNPVVLLYPGVGMFTFAKDKQTARVAAEFYINAINVMKGAEAISEYVSLPRQEAFNIEYWLLEEAKLQRMPKPKTLSGSIALITGSAGGIGKAIAKKFAQEGACVVINDIHEERLNTVLAEFQAAFGKDSVTGVTLDVCDIQSIARAFENTSRAFGGVDITVNNAGISISSSLAEHSIEDWDKLFDILVKGQFLVSRNAVNIMRKQNMGGDIINIVSKNSIVAGPNNSGYSAAKSAQAHLSRLLSVELGGDNVRVNAVNPGVVIAESHIWMGEWAQGRAKAYGITVEELPAFYAKRTLLNKTIGPGDIANACFALVSGLLGKSTGMTINVDGGEPAAFVR